MGEIKALIANVLQNMTSLTSDNYGLRGTNIMNKYDPIFVLLDTLALSEPCRINVFNMIEVCQEYNN